jgi:DNA-binding transcriptional MocR family regulator
MSGIIAEQIPGMLAEVPAQLLRIRERTRNNLVSLEEALPASESGVVSLLQPEGGWNVLLRFPSVIDETELVTTLIEQHATTAQPGYFFDMVSNGYVAVSLLPDPEEFRKGIATLLTEVDELL